MCLDADYSSALKSLGVDQFLKLPESESKDELLVQYILKAIFYSKDESDPHNKSIEELVVTGKIAGKDGDLSDGIQRSRVYKVRQRLMDLEESGVTIGNVLGLRSTLIEDVYGNGKHHHDLRRYRLSNGPHITANAEKVGAAMAKTLLLLDDQKPSVAEAHVQASRFISEFLNVHPFEDANGRTSRILYNWYAIRNGLRPIHVSGETKDALLSYMHPFFISGYLGSAVALTVRLSLDKEREAGLLDALDRSRADSPYEVELRHNLHLLTDPQRYARIPESEKLKSDIADLYQKGMKGGDKSLVSAAVWLSSAAKIDNGELFDLALQNKDPGVRALTIYAIGNLKLHRYKPKLLDILGDRSEDENVRMQAAVQLGESKGKTSNEVVQVLGIATRPGAPETVVLAIAKYYALRGEGSEADRKRMLEFGKWLMASKSEEYKLRGYQTYIVHANEQEIAGLVKNGIGGLSGVVKKEIVVELSREEKVRGRPVLNHSAIATELSKIAEFDAGVRRPLLGELIMADKINPNYVPFLDKIIESGIYEKAEKAHAIYALSRVKGIEYLIDRHLSKGHISPDNRSENLAVLLSLPVNKELDDRRQGLLGAFIESTKFKERIIASGRIFHALRRDGTGENHNGSTDGRLLEAYARLLDFDRISATYARMDRHSVFNSELKEHMRRVERQRPTKIKA